MPDVKLPLLGTVKRGPLIAGLGAAVVVGGYVIYRHNKNTAVAAAYGYGGATGASAYGYAAGLPYNSFYGYGSNYAPAGVTPYPVGEEYGYGAYGYGYYNPYTGQYMGGGTGTGVVTPVTQPTTGTTSPTSGLKSGWVTIGGKKYYFSSAKGTLGGFTGKGKKRKWVKTKV
jgi:hypothetical protein